MNIAIISLFVFIVFVNLGYTKISNIDFWQKILCQIYIRISLNTKYNRWNAQLSLINKNKASILNIKARSFSRILNFHISSENWVEKNVALVARSYGIRTYFANMNSVVLGFSLLGNLWTLQMETNQFQRIMTVGMRITL